MNSEIWKDIEEYPYYQASNMGRIRSLDRTITYSDSRVRMYKGQVLSPSHGANGYYSVSLKKSSISKTMYVHQVVASVFLGYNIKSRECVVDHIDNRKGNNKASNLRLISHRENVSKGMALMKKTSKYTGVRLNKGKWESQIRNGNSRHYLGRFEKEEEAAEAYNNKLKELENGL